jgi:hypothetical protein
MYAAEDALLKTHEVASFFWTKTLKLVYLSKAARVPLSFFHSEIGWE